MIVILRKARNVMRESQRMDSIYRGPIHSTFTNVVTSLVSLRSYERLGYFREEFIDSLEKSCNITFTYYTVNRWMGVMLDFVCMVFTLATAAFSIYAKNIMSTEYLAFTLQIITDVIVFFSFSIRMSGEIENFLTSS